MLHFRIGKRLQQKAAPDEETDHIFMVVDQLNAGRVMLTKRTGTYRTGRTKPVSRQTGQSVRCIRDRLALF